MAEKFSIMTPFSGLMLYTKKPGDDSEYNDEDIVENLDEEQRKHKEDVNVVIESTIDWQRGCPVAFITYGSYLG